MQTDTTVKGNPNSTNRQLRCYFRRSYEVLEGLENIFDCWISSIPVKVSRRTNAEWSPECGLTLALASNLTGLDYENAVSGEVAFLWRNQQPACSVVVERMSTISLGMSTSVPDDNPSSTTAANDSVSPFLTLLISSLTRKEELVGYKNLYSHSDCSNNTQYKSMLKKKNTLKQKTQREIKKQQQQQNAGLKPWCLVSMHFTILGSDATQQPQQQNLCITILVKL